MAELAARLLRDIQMLYVRHLEQMRVHVQEHRLWVESLNNWYGP